MPRSCFSRYTQLNFGILILFPFIQCLETTLSSSIYSRLEDWERSGEGGGSSSTHNLGDLGLDLLALDGVLELKSQRSKES